MNDESPPVEDRRTRYAFEVYEKNPELAPDYKPPYNERQKCKPLFPNRERNIFDKEQTR